MCLPHRHGVQDEMAKPPNVIQMGVRRMRVVELRVASCELRVASCELRVASCELQTDKIKILMINTNTKEHLRHVSAWEYPRL